MLDRIAAGRTDLVYDWLANDGAPSASVDGADLINWCAYYGDVSAIRGLLQAGETLEKLGDNIGLAGAAFHGHWRLCEFLLERGADPNFADPDCGEVALHAALCSRESYEHEQVVRVLLSRNADPNRLTRPGVETGGFMRDVRTRGEAPLHRAAAFGTAEAIQLLLDAGATVDQRDAAGDSPLSWASWALRSTEILCLLTFDPHRINPERRSMREYLVGRPATSAR
jgi:ankyrin repeat protein